MAGIIWTNPTLGQLEDVAQYIALDKPAAASGFVQRVFSAAERLQRFPDFGRVPTEPPNSIYRELLVKPCRIFYRSDGDVVLIVHVMREERPLRHYLLNA